MYNVAIATLRAAVRAPSNERRSRAAQNAETHVALEKKTPTLADRSRDFRAFARTRDILHTASELIPCITDSDKRILSAATFLVVGVRLITHLSLSLSLRYRRR